MRMNSQKRGNKEDLERKERGRVIRNGFMEGERQEQEQEQQEQQEGYPLLVKPF
jgi:D-alanine-D-alanine ligase-like ATP-grasp enzyme